MEPARVSSVANPKHKRRRKNKPAESMGSTSERNWGNDMSQSTNESADNWPAVAQASFVGLPIPVNFPDRQFPVALENYHSGFRGARCRPNPATMPNSNGRIDPRGDQSRSDSWNGSDSWNRPVPVGSRNSAGDRNVFVEAHHSRLPYDNQRTFFSKAQQEDRSPFRTQTSFAWQQQGTNSATRGDQGTATEKLKLMTEIQRQVYYENLPNKVTPKAMIQFKRDKFPIEKNQVVYIDNKFELIVRTLCKMKACCVEVKFQKSSSRPYSLQVAELLLALEAGEDVLRKACIDCFIHLENKSGKASAIIENKASLEFLSARFINLQNENQEVGLYCCVCDMQFTSMTDVRKHLEQPQHSVEEEKSIQREKLKNDMIGPTPQQLQAINTAIRRHLDAAEPERDNLREFAFNLIQSLRESVFNPLQIERVEIYGSILYDCHNPLSDVNILFTTSLPIAEKVDQVLQSVMDYQKSHSQSADACMSTDYRAEGIVFTYDTRQVRLCWKISSNFHTSQLLLKYVDVVPQAKNFMRMVRSWASAAGIDGRIIPNIGIPQTCLDLMSIHYLQHMGKAPILHEEFAQYDNIVNDVPVSDLAELKAEWEHEVYDYARLLIDFFKFYMKRNEVVQITQQSDMAKNPSFRRKGKGLLIIDPHRENQMFFQKMFLHFLQNCLLVSYVYFMVPQTAKGPVVDIEFFQKKSETVKNKKKREEPAKPETGGGENRNAEKFASFPALDPVVTPEPELEISMLNDMKITDEEHDAAADAMADELGDEDFAVDDNDFAVDEEQDVEDEAHRMERLSCILFDGIPLKDLGADDVEIDEHSDCIYSRRTTFRVRRKYGQNVDRSKVENFDALYESNVVSDEDDGGSEDQVDTPSESAENVELPAEVSLGLPITTTSWSHPCVVREALASAKKPALKPTADENLTNAAPAVQYCVEDFYIRMSDGFSYDNIVRMAQDMRASDFVYKFDVPFNFNHGYSFDNRCSVCNEKHLVENCPKMMVPNVEEITNLRSTEEMQLIDNMIEEHYVSLSMPGKRKQAVLEAVNELQVHLEKHFQELVRLELFGSMMNGMDMCSSDADICFRFQSDTMPENLDPVKVILGICKAFTCGKLANTVRNVMAITTAKVPIVKFKLKTRVGFIDADISYYNVLALFNTRMLKRYCTLSDNKLAKLGLFVKHWAKICNVGDASKGTLSSYAYVIMLIHYLQNCHPVVLPRLQEDYIEQFVSRVVDNWETYYCEEEVGFKSRNTQSLGELFIGFLDYYSRYDFKKYTIQMRTKAPVSKVEKEWNTKELCIEDPFELSHNLGAGIKKRMWVFIRRVIICSRQTFMDASIHRQFLQQGAENVNTREWASGYKQFLLRSCSQGEPPYEHQCRRCHRIGHFVDSCPQAAASKGRPKALMGIRFSKHYRPRPA